MKKYNFYNPSKHEGYLPVRVLPDNFIDWFINVTPEFIDEVKYEVDANGLRTGIRYKINRSPISTIAEITTEKAIVLYENYNQYLWCICYSLLVLFDETIHKPTTEGRYTGRFDFSNLFVSDACQVFTNAMVLLSKYDDNIFFQSPNPEAYGQNDSYYIERTNGLYSAAMTFILLHEFGHQYFGHLEYNPTPDDSKKDELLVDEFAIERMSANFGQEKGVSMKTGIVLAMSSLLLMDSSLSGGTYHPDSDDRLTNALEKLSLNELDNCWGIACLTISFWAMHYKHPLEMPLVVDNYKEHYYLLIEAVKKLPR